MKFQYGRDRVLKLDDNRKRAIELGYMEADERKRRERQSKIIFWIVVVIVILLILGYILVKR